MSAPVFIGDELTAAAYRLAGLDVHSPAEDEALAAFQRACEEAELVLVTAEYAQMLPAREFQRAQAGLSPAVVVVADVRGRRGLPDMGERMRHTLGMEGE